MTDAERRTAILKLIKENTTANTVSKAAALECLIKDGIYNRDGSLSVNYGGKPKKDRTET